MSKKITISQKFNRPIAEVFALLSKHATYNQAFWPAKVRRIKDSADPQRPDGVGSIRQLRIGPFNLVKELVTVLEEDNLIEYKIIHNPLVRHHLGQLKFQAISDKQTLLTYTIEFEAKLPLSSLIVLTQLKLAVTLGMAKLAHTLK